MRPARARSSLGWRVLAYLLLGEIVFALMLSAAIAAFSAIAVADERAQAVRSIAALIAASVMPTVAEQEAPQVQAQVANVLEAAAVPDLDGICITDASGAVITCSEGLRHDSEAEQETEGSGTVWAPLTEVQTVQQPIQVDGLRVATVSVRFSPPDLMDSLAVPLIAAGVALAAIVLVSVPWTAYRVTADVAEPLEGLAVYASRVAAGDLDAEPDRGAVGEIGELQYSLAHMAAELKERDERLHASIEDLSHANASLERAKSEIEQLARTKENFVAVAAHEIRGPLTTIRLYAEMLEAGERGPLERAAREAVDAIVAASSRLSSIAADLTDAALLDRGLMPMQFSVVALAPLVEAAIRDAGVLGASRGIRVRAEGPVPDASVSADPVRLRQVLDNLLSNAIKYSPEGTDVMVSGARHADAVEVAVADRGRGVPEGSEHHLFALFGRLDAADNRDTAGLGLGLAISARIVDAHHGRIGHRPNNGGQGSVFTVTLPLASAPHAPKGSGAVQTRDDAGR